MTLAVATNKWKTRDFHRSYLMRVHTRLSSMILLLRSSECL